MSTSYHEQQTRLKHDTKSLWSSKVVLVVKNLPVKAGDVREAGLIPGSGRLLWRRVWQPRPVFLRGESHGWRGLGGYSICGCKESDVTEATQHTHVHKVSLGKGFYVSLRHEKGSDYI